MTWTAEATAVTGTPLTAAFWNANVRDNVTDLDRRTNAGVGVVGTAEGTTSTTYTDLATVGPVATANVGSTGICIVVLTARLFNAAAGVQTIMSYAVSGQTTLAADDTKTLYFRSDSANQDMRASSLTVATGWNPGLNTVTAKYHSGTSTGCTFADRNVALFPLGR